MTAFQSQEIIRHCRLKGSSISKPAGSALLTVKSPSLILPTILIIVLNIRSNPAMPPYSSHATSEVAETRCECGQLIAKVRAKALELKCKRCKRIVIIPFHAIEGWTASSSQKAL